MPVHQETRSCKACGSQFSLIVKRGRPRTKCDNCRSKSKETPSNV